LKKGAPKTQRLFGKKKKKQKNRYRNKGAGGTPKFAEGTGAGG